MHGKGHAGVASLAVVVLTLGAAGGASAAPSKLTPGKAKALEEAIGDEDTAGSYYDRKNDNMVVTVTSKQAADKVRDAGGIVRVVKYDGLTLGRVDALLRRDAKIGGTAFGIDPVENKVVLTADSSVSASNLDKLEAIADKLGDRIRLERTSGVFEPLVSGGDAIFGGSSRCSLGFNVTRAGVAHLLTAGHCGQVISTWSIPGTTVAYSFPNDDYALVRYTSTTPTRPGNVTLYNGTFQEISSAGDAYVGQNARKSGSTTRVSSGTVQALNQTVNYGAKGIVYGVIRTNICAQPGDSGGALFAGTVALGLVSGGSGSCATGGTVFYQPVKEALARYGAVIY